MRKEVQKIVEKSKFFNKETAFSEKKLNELRTDIAVHLNNNAYYSLSKNHIFCVLDSAGKNAKIDLGIKIKFPKGETHKKFHIKDVYVSVAGK